MIKTFKLELGIIDILDIKDNNVTSVNAFDQGHVLFVEHHYPHPNSSRTHFRHVEPDCKTKQRQYMPNAISLCVGKSICNFIIKVFENLTKTCDITKLK